MSDLLLMQIEKQFNLDGIDRRRRNIFQDVGDLVVNQNALGPAFIAHFKAAWAAHHEAELKKCLLQHFPKGAMHLLSAGHFSQQSMMYVMKQNNRQYLIKSSACLELPDALFLNHFLMQDISSCALTIPLPGSQLLFLESGQPIQIMEKISDKTVRQVFEENSSGVHREQIMQKLGVILARIHTIQGSQFGAVSLSSLIRMHEKKGLHNTLYEFLLLNFERHLDCCIRQSRVTKQKAADILKLFDRHQDLFQNSPTVLLHGDFVKNNLLAHRGEIVGVLDWEDALIGDPLFELASLSLAYLAEDFDVLFRAYEKARNQPFTPQDQMKLYLYRLRLYISKLMFNDSFQQKTKSSFPKANKLLFLYDQTKKALEGR